MKSKGDRTSSDVSRPKNAVQGEADIPITQPHGGPRSRGDDPPVPPIPIRCIGTPKLQHAQASTPRIHRILLSLLALVAILASINACAQRGVQREVLVNGSFENPVVPQGNNFLHSLEGWSISADTHPVDPANGSFNVIRPNGAYGTGPSMPPTGGGSQYLDIVDSGGIIRQDVTLNRKGTIQISAAFSQRDYAQSIDRAIVRVRDDAGRIVSEASTTFDGSYPLDTWRMASAFEVAVEPGTYHVEVDIANAVNVDMVSLLYRPEPAGILTMEKTVRTVGDPYNRTNNPKAIPGAFVSYTINVRNEGDGDVDADTQVLHDPTPENMTMAFSDRFPISFQADTSGMTLRYSGASDSTDDVEFSMDGGTSWNYTPRGGNSGDPNVTNVRFKPKGVMKAGTAYAVKITYLVR